MIVLSEVSEPSEGVRVAQPQVTAFFENDSIGEGMLTVAESCVTWISRSTGRGFSLTYPSIILHATSSDTTAFPHECLYVLVDASKSGLDRPRGEQIPIYSAAEAQQGADLNVAARELAAGDGEEEGEDEEEASNVAIRFVPADTSCLQQLYTEMGKCQELHPDEDDDFSDEDGGEEMDDMSGGAALDMGGMGGGQWYTADNMGEMGEVQLSEEGLANLQRMMGGGGGGQNGHHDENDEEMDQ